ncbi:MAG TPA: histidine phosphatase family protein [Candidatus Krumholzibacteria bacterium]|nr:histidine phosphatase family protein [Candidatus Krumholzibacteria bacterium]
MKLSRIQALLAALVIAVAGCGPRAAEGPATLRIYLARHGQTDWNAERRLQGQTDRMLDETGRRQAAQLAESLRGIRLDAVYSSTLGRSRETADIARGGVPLTSMDGLRERAIGKFEGLRLAGEDTASVSEFRRRSQDPEDSLDGGESSTQFYVRVRQAFEAIRDRHPAGTILVVGHGGTNQMILRTLFDLAPEQAESIRQANDEIYMIEIEAGMPPRLWKRIAAANLSDL